MAGPDPDEDPGWHLSPRLLRFLVPGYLRYSQRRRHAGTEPDGLTTIREVWTSFTAAVVLIGVVAPVVGGEPDTGSISFWVAVLAVASVLGLMAAERLGQRPLDCTGPAALAGSYRTRFFLRTALSESIALVAFVLAILAGRWWVYWLFLPFTLYGFGRNAPTSGHLEADQERLRLAGCQLSLVGALRGSAG